MANEQKEEEEAEDNGEDGDEGNDVDESDIVFLMMKRKKFLVKNHLVKH